MAETPSGGMLSIEYESSSGVSSISGLEWSGSFLSAGEGWLEGVGGEFFGFYSDAWENENDPFPPPRNVIRYAAPRDAQAQRSDLVQRELALLLEEIERQDLPMSYLGCVGSVAVTVGATIAGVQQHGTQARARRMGMISRARLAASVTATGLIVGGTAAVSAAVCLPQLTN